MKLGRSKARLIVVAMQEAEVKELGYAYRYPFSATAREIIQKLDIKEINQKYLEAGAMRVQEAVENGTIEFVRTRYEELMYTYLLSYVYARMIASALKSVEVLRKYARAEARRAEEALEGEDAEDIVRVAKDVALETGLRDGLFYIRFQSYLRYMPREEEFALVRQRLGGGLVYLQKERFLKVLSRAIASRVGRGLPIEAKDLPKEVLEKAKKIRIPAARIRVSGDETGRYAWIDKLLSTPIADVRHRTVNIILAPYLVNVKGLDAEAAAKVIIEYIEKCKAINPDTKINDSYIRYQCRYAKAKGLKPMSLRRAKELLHGIVELS